MKTAEEIISIPPDLEGVDVPRIMEDIKRRVEERRQSGLYRELPTEELERMRVGERGEVTIQDPLHEIIFNIELARHFAAVSSWYPIGARRTPLGPFILLAKKILRRFMTPYMEAVFDKQREFNMRVLEALKVFQEIIVRERERNYRAGVDRYYAWEELGLAEEDGEFLEEAARRFPPDKEIVHLWCGRGEFLEAARREGREALGVEEDPRLVRICQGKNLRVQQASSMDYLEGQPADSLPAVFLRDLGERGELGDLMWLLGVLASRLERDGVAVIVNHHPRSVLGTEEAFVDPSLVRLIHPETMEGLLKGAGFRDLRVTSLDGFSPDEEREWMERLGGMGLELQDLRETLFAPRRYLVEARK